MTYNVFGGTLSLTQSINQRMVKVPCVYRNTGENFNRLSVCIGAQTDRTVDDIIENVNVSQL